MQKLPSNTDELSQFHLGMLKIYHQASGLSPDAFDECLQKAMFQMIPYIRNVKKLLTPSLILHSCCEVFAIPTDDALKKKPESETRVMKYIYYMLCKKYIITGEKSIYKLFSTGRSNMVQMTDRGFSLYEVDDKFKALYHTCENHLLSQTFVQM